MAMQRIKDAAEKAKKDLSGMSVRKSIYHLFLKMQMDHSYGY